MQKKCLYGLIKLLAKLPLWILYLFSDIITPVLYHLMRYRRKVVESNLIEAFPEKTGQERKRIEKGFYRYLGDQIVETLKLLHISDEELKKRIEVRNFELINQAIVNERNAVILMGHYCNWEWVQEIVRYFTPRAFLISIYHPLKDKFWDDVFIKVRSRWKAHIVPMKTAPRVLLNRSNQPWVCGFIADARTDTKNDDNCIRFLNHDTWFITGPEIIGDKVGSEYFYLEMKRLKRGRYEIAFHALHPRQEDISYPYLRQFWREFENTIKAAPSYWLWSHKRWK